MSVDEVVRNRTRDIILREIRDKPGITFTRLMRLLDLNEGTLRYHLNYLERKEMINSSKDGQKRIYFNSPGEGPGPGLDLTYQQTRVLNLIRRSPGISRSEIIETVPLTRRGLRYILEKLKKDHLIWENGKGPDARYEVINSRKVLDEMLLQLVERFLKGEIDQNTFLHLKERIETKMNNS
jgi:predicted transcriptional regulator